LAEDLGVPQAEARNAAAETTGDPAPGSRRRNLIAFIITVVVVLIVLALLPTVVVSLSDEMRGQDFSRVYELFTGQVIDPGEIPATDAAFVNITATNLNEGRRVVTLTVSGNRVCPALCPPVTATFYSLGSEAAQRRGLPPSAPVTLPGTSGSYTSTIELPIRGQPQRYPFDTYTLLLGLIVSVELPNGEQQIVDSQELAQRNVSLTFEDQVAHLNMKPPIPVDPATVRAPSDPTAFLVVDQLTWERPRYLRILTVLLLLLISASGLLALGLRSLNELVLGIGGIILGVWGVRSVVVQTSLPDVTLVDALLALLILILLLALAIRAARHFYLKSGLRK
jgi:hypothetical protein